MNSRASSEASHFRRVTDRAAAQMQAEAQHRQVPADPDRTRAELVPHLRWDDRDVLQFEAVRLSPAAVSRTSTSLKPGFSLHNQLTLRSVGDSQRRSHRSHCPQLIRAADPR
jgi:hypothetical protein